MKTFDKYNDQFYSRLFKLLPDVYYIFNIHSGAVYCSDNVEKVLKFKKQTLDKDPMTWTNSIHEEDKPRIKKLLNNLKPGEHFEVDYRITNGEGKLMWLLDRGLNIYEEDSELIIEGWVVDITEHKERELEVLKKNIMLETAEEIASVGSFELDLEHQRIVTSKIWQHIHGANKESFGLEELLTFAHPDDIQRIEQAFKDVKKNNEYNLVHRIVRGDDGSIRYVHAKGLLPEDPGGGLNIIYGSVQDITDKMLAEKKIRESLDDLNLAQKITKVGNWKYDPDQSAPVWSEEVYRIYERSEEEGPYRVNDYKKIYEPDQYEIFKNAFNAAVNEGKPYDIQLKIKTKTGTEKYINAICQPAEEPTAKGYFLRGTIQDITREVQSFQSLEDARKNLERLNNDKNLLLSLISHDLRSPFNSILGLSKILDRRYHKFDDEKRRKIIKSLANQLSVLYNLTDNLLTWATLQKGSLPFEPEPVELRELLKKVITTSLPTALQKEVALELEGRELMAHADREMLKTVFRNLVNNAIKYSSANDTVKITIHPVIIDGRNYAEVSVCDCGIGISKQRLKQIFDVSEDKSTPGTADEQGSGIGLLICRDFTEKNGGTISVESEEGKGACFSVRLPVSESAIESR